MPNKTAIIFIIFSFLLSGCATRETDPRKDVKFTDISPMYKKDKIPTPDISAELAIFIIETPIDNYQKFKQIWETLYTNRIVYGHKIAFQRNELVLGFGPSEKLTEIENIMLETDSRKSATTYLMATEKLDDKIFVSKTSGSHELFYNTSATDVAGVTLPPGKAGLKIDMNKIPAAKGIIEVIVKPFFHPFSAADEKDIHFRHIRFQADLTPGDFLLFGCSSYDGDPGTFKGLFFANPAALPTIKTYIIACKSIKDQ